MKAYRVAVQHLTSPSVCAACVAFTEMLGLDSTSLRVDIQAASRVLAHAALEDLLGDDAKEDSTIQDAIGKKLSCSVPQTFFINDGQFVIPLYVYSFEFCRR